MNSLSSFSLVFIVCVVSSIAVGQEASCPKPIAYENHNQVTPPALVLRSVTGRAMISADVPVANVCLGLFTEKGHRLIASGIATDNGNFNFRNIRAGLYRLVVKDRFGGLSTASVPLRVSRKGRPRRFVVHMRVGGIDTCSYGDYK